ncbi:protein of unknown function [Nitrospira japonica]|uniref:Uncharacterized protein n=1 Tax=Nitrospira japonica TaxID=1325564 RepID=A0A1W1I0L1_9BACT|nr:protein of unknown function [Nitrospira japonica]
MKLWLNRGEETVDSTEGTRDEMDSGSANAPAGAHGDDDPVRYRHRDVVLARVCSLV